MSDTKNVVDFSGLSTTLLVITFVILKALGYITWSWWWVFCPYWIPLALVLSIGGVVIAGCGIVMAVLSIWELIRKK